MGKPKYTLEQKIPFIPTEQEINSLIARSGRKPAAFLQPLEEEKIFPLLYFRRCSYNSATSTCI